MTDYGDHHYQRLGFGTFILMSPPDPDVLQTFIQDVAPDVRERVAAARAPAASDPALATADPASR